MSTLPPTRIELSSSKLCNNVASIRERLQPGVIIYGVVKANAYGHGLEQVASAIAGVVDGYQVDDLAELARLRSITEKEILLLGYLARDEVHEAIRLGATISVSSLSTVRQLDEYAQKAGVIQSVLLALDTGFGREGVLVNDLQALYESVLASSNLTLRGVFSHFSSADETSHQEHTTAQYALYRDAQSLLRHHSSLSCSSLSCFHIANTAGVLNPAVQHDHLSSAIRLGLGLYGYWPSEELKALPINKGLSLSPALSWISWISQIKDLPANYPVGYGRSYITQKPTRVGIVPQGYSDGYNRLLSNQGEVLVHGKRCAVLGRVSMNMMSIDISEVPYCEIGDEVVLLGCSGGEVISADDLAKLCSTISYEVLTSISPFLPRCLIP